MGMMCSEHNKSFGFFTPHEGYVIPALVEDLLTIPWDLGRGLMRFCNEIVGFMLWSIPLAAGILSLSASAPLLLASLPLAATLLPVATNFLATSIQLKIAAGAIAGVLAFYTLESIAKSAFATFDLFASPIIDTLRVTTNLMADVVSGVDNTVRGIGSTVCSI